MMDWIEDNFGKAMIIFIIFVCIGYIISAIFCHKQLVEDYMKEFNIDKETAERRIRIDRNSNKKVMYYNINTKTFMTK